MKCRQCGLVNFRTESNCKRCGAPLTDSSESPVNQSQKPAVWGWYVAYCVAMAILYLFVATAGFYSLFIDPAGARLDTPEAHMMAKIFTVLGGALLVPFAAGPFLPRCRWAWVFGLILICSGMTSACCLPAAIPLLIWWLKPETKEYYNMAGGATRGRVA